MLPRPYRNRQVVEERKVKVAELFKRRAEIEEIEANKSCLVCGATVGLSQVVVAGELQHVCREHVDAVKEKLAELKAPKLEEPVDAGV